MTRQHFPTLSLLSSTALVALLTTGCPSRTEAPPPDSLNALPSESAPAASAPSTTSTAKTAAPARAVSVGSADAAASSSGAVSPSSADAAASSSSAVSPSSADAATPTLSSSARALASSVSEPSTKIGTSLGSDPLGGQFTLADATAGLPKSGKLLAEMKTDAGVLRCTLYEDKAPNTVANFVGLARGLRPFKDPKSKEWVKRPAYDDGVFHRIIRGFMIQGGDPTGTGRTDGGYVIPDEIWEGAHHDRRGLLCMANRGKNTNSMQFFILDGPAPHLDGGYTIFGECGPESVIKKLADTEVRGDRAVKPPKIERVTIKRSP